MIFSKVNFSSREITAVTRIQKKHPLPPLMLSDNLPIASPWRLIHNLTRQECPYSPLLRIYIFLRIGKPCRSGSSGTFVPSDQDLHCLLSSVRNNLINLKANSADPDQMPRMCRLIWIYTVRPCLKGMFMEERVKGHNYCQINTPNNQFVKCHAVVCFPCIVIIKLSLYSINAF
jgi:hypothetical protein